MLKHTMELVMACVMWTGLAHAQVNVGSNAQTDRPEVEGQGSPSLVASEVPEHDSVQDTKTGSMAFYHAGTGGITGGDRSPFFPLPLLGGLGLRDRESGLEYSLRFMLDGNNTNSSIRVMGVSHTMPAPEDDSAAYVGGGLGLSTTSLEKSDKNYSGSGFALELMMGYEQPQTSGASVFIQADVSLPLHAQGKGLPGLLNFGDEDAKGQMVPVFGLSMGAGVGI